MEAPEKIYIQSFNVSEEDAKFERKLYFDDVWTEEPESGEENIEYIRTDAFIKKACEFINKANLYLYHCISEECDLVDTDKMIEDFKNYMKGE